MQAAQINPGEWIRRGYALTQGRYLRLLGMHLLLNALQLLMVTVPLGNCILAVAYRGSGGKLPAAAGPGVRAVQPNGNTDLP